MRAAAGFVLAFLGFLAPTQAADDQGKVVYEAQCVPCHGMAGEGGYGAKLATPHLAHARSKADIIKIIAGGIPGTNMPSFGLLADIEIAQAAAYVQTLGQVPEAPLPGDPLKGKAVFEAKGCPSCHIMRGVGSGFGPELTEVGIRRNIEYLRNKITNPNVQITEGFESVKAVNSDGSVVEGVKINEDSFTVQIRDASRRLHSLRKTDLKQYSKLKTSMMPAYGRSLSSTELNDLVSFLAAREDK
jgi:cytochrome c oxidase cbb3-type subunit III